VTTVTDDFTDAHDRHWRDAEYLSGFVSRLLGFASLANADHLYGLSAECGLKAVLVAAGQPIEKPYKDHVDKVWPLFVSFAHGRLGARYLAMLPAGEPFRDWEVSQRYWHRRYFRRARLTPHRDAAMAVRAMLQFAVQGGSP